MKRYHHLTYEQRCQIYTLKARNILQKDIASILGVSESTVSRELKRNKGNRGYRYKQAHKMAQFRRKISRNPIKIKGSFKILIDTALSMQWSPFQISGFFKVNNNED